MEDSLYNIHDFISKIDWEGGIYSALEYGLKTGDYNLPKHLEVAWNEIRELFSELDSLATDFWTEAEKYADTVSFEEDN